MTNLFDPRFPLAHTGFIGSPVERDDRIQRSPETLWAARMHPGARWMLLDGLNPLLTEDGPDIQWLRRSEVPEAEVEVYLGLEDGCPRFAIGAKAAAGLPGTPVEARRAATLMDDGRAAIIAQARSLIDWHQRHGFCANCGAPTEMTKAGYARLCSGCGAEHFPRTDPVVIMLAVDGDRVLLGRQSRFPKGFLSALAGFVEAGECFEDAVRREIREEAGIRTGRVSYVSSQPWPFPSSLMIGCFVEALSTEISIDEEEMEEVRWVTRGECIAALAGNGMFTVPPPMAIARTLLETWVAATA